jgi:23S rRNA (uracil-5-)-methyltransferase RumA
MMKTGTILDVDIVDMAFGGQGIAKVATDGGDFVIFVPNALPAQKVTIRIIKKKKNYAEAKLVAVVQPSPRELTLPYQPIAGAPFARLPIEEQIEYKRSTTMGMFARLSAFPNVADFFDEYVASPAVWHYRNKMEYSFSTLCADPITGEEEAGFALGFKKRGQWWSVEKLDKDSGLFDEALENGLHRLREFCEKTGLPAWNPAKSEGFFRFLVVRKSVADDELLFNLVVTSKDYELFDAKAFAALLEEVVGKNRLAGLWLTRNDDQGDAAKQPAAQTQLICGKPKIQENILGLSFEISMQSFFQTNPLCAEKLYAKALDYVGEALAETGGEGLAMDLFCGTGTIAQLLSRLEAVKQVVGVDIVEEAIEDAKANALRNGLGKKMKFHAADVGKFLQEYPQYANKISVIVLDPPRAGIAPKTLTKVISLGAKAIVYISCNPSTQARDTIELKAAGYALRRFALVDQFPHTSHIESVALFVKA